MPKAEAAEATAAATTAEAVAFVVLVDVEPSCVVFCIFVLLQIIKNKLKKNFFK